MSRRGSFAVEVDTGDGNDSEEEVRLAVTTTRPSSVRPMAPPVIRAYQAAPSLAHSLVLARLAQSPTLLPQTIAKLISNLTLVARVSLRTTALFIEAILESVKQATLKSFGITRRALIAAVSSARTLNYVNERLDWSGRDGLGKRTNDAFLAVLDNYSNAGIYIVHHAFTLAELFAMSGFYLSMTSVQTGFGAAEESVRMLDGVFGSTETSRALASVINLVRGELTGDARFGNRNIISTLATLTKTLTAFVCLQTATHKRTVREMRLKVVYDCTVVLEGEAEKAFALGMEGRPGRNIEQAHSWGQPRPRTTSMDTIMSDARTEFSSVPRSRTVSVQEEQAGIVEGLQELIGSREAKSPGDSEDEELPEDVRKALEEMESNGDAGEIKRLVREPGGVGYEIEVETTTTTTTTVLRVIKAAGGEPRTIARRIADRPALPGVGSGVRRSDAEEPSIVELVEDDDGDDDWVEIGADFNMQSVGTTSRADALHHPAESRERLQVVLKSMTKHFTQKSRTIRRLDPVISRSNSPSPNRASQPSGALDRRGKSRKLDTTPSANDAVNGDESGDVPMGSSSPPKGAGVFRAFSKALRKPSSRTSLASMFSATSPRRSSRATTAPNTTSLGVGMSTPLKAESGVTSPSPPPSPPSTPPTRASPSFKSCPSTISSEIAAEPPRSATKPTSSIPPHLRRKASAMSMTSLTTHSTSAPTVDPEPRSGNFPHRHLVSNLQIFMRYASASYGQTFLRILGMGKQDYTFPSTEIHANNHAFAHHVGIKVQDILLSSYTDPQTTYSNEKLAPIINFVSVDHTSKAIVLACRGSLGLSDILVDLTCAYEAVSVEHGSPSAHYFVHGGMWGAATLLQRGKVHDTIKEALLRYPEYGLVLCGHSLGGGVAALLSVIWSSPASAYKAQAAVRIYKPTHPSIRTPFVTSFSSGLPPGRPISCFAFGPPAVTSPDLSRYCKGLVTSVAHNFDIVPTLSLGTLRDLKTMALGLDSESGTAEEIVGRVVGLQQQRFVNGCSARILPNGKPTITGLTELSEEANKVGLSDEELGAGRSSNRALENAYKDPSILGPEMTDDKHLQDWLWSLVKTMRAGNDSDKLYPPGTCYLIESWTVFISETGSSSQASTESSANPRYSRKEGRRVVLRAVENVETRFSEPVFGRSMMSDHSPANYEAAVDGLAAAVLPTAS